MESSHAIFNQNGLRVLRRGPDDQEIFDDIPDLLTRKAAEYGKRPVIIISGALARRSIVFRGRMPDGSCFGISHFWFNPGPKSQHGEALIQAMRPCGYYADTRPCKLYIEESHYHRLVENREANLYELQQLEQQGSVADYEPSATLSRSRRHIEKSAVPPSISHFNLLSQ